MTPLINMTMSATAVPRKLHHPPMAATATLTNCYVPLSATSNSLESTNSFDPFSRASDDDHHHHSIANNNTPTTDAASSEQRQRRGPRTLRQIHLERSILSQSTGSSLVEWGHTKLMVSVRGPRPVNCSSMNAANNGGGLVCEVRYMPHIGIRMETLAQHSLSQDFSSKTSGGARIPRDALGTAQDTSLLSSGGSLCAPAAFLDETYLSHRLHEALSPAVILNGMGGAKMCVEVFVEVLQSDGGVFNAAVLGASLALVDAGIPMRDVVCAGSAAVMKVETAATATAGTTKDGEIAATVQQKTMISYHVIADPTEEELLQACGVLTIALMPNWREVTVWDQFGKMSMDSSSEATDLARDGCMTMLKFLKNCLLNGGG